MSEDSRQAQDFTAAVEAFVAVVADLPEGAWERPGLGVWSVRELVGHTSRSLTTVTDYLDVLAEQVDVEDPAGYFLAVLQTTSHEAVAERGRASARALGDHPVETVRALASAAVEAIAGADRGTLVRTPAGGMRLLDYLPTRTFELTVHSLDLLGATGMRRELPAGPVHAATQVSVELAARQGKAVDVLLALNNRQRLGPDFAIL